MDKEKGVTELISLSIIPFTSKIIGADDKFMYIKEEYYEDKEELMHTNNTSDSLPCVIKVKRKDFNEMIKLWINRKAEYNKNWGHFCGVFGNFYIEEYENIGNINLLTGFDEEKEDCIYEEVPIYEVIKFSKHCDMEHG